MATSVTYRECPRSRIPKIKFKAPRVQGSNTKSKNKAKNRAAKQARKKNR